jgi:hypothetical protein
MGGKKKNLRVNIIGLILGSSWFESSSWFDRDI